MNFILSYIPRPGQSGQLLEGQHHWNLDSPLRATALRLSESRLLPHAVMRDLPRSVHSTPGMVAMCDAGVVPNDVPNFGGLQLSQSARTSSIAKMRVPRFGHLTIVGKNDTPYRGGILVESILSKVDVPDRVAVFGSWIYDKEDFESGKFVDLKALFRSDPQSKKNYMQLDADACVLDLDATQVGGFAQFEQSASVARNGETVNPLDGDAIKVGAIIRRHPWRKNGWRRLELLPEGWTAEDLMRLRDEVYYKQRPVAPAIEPLPPIGVTTIEVRADRVSQSRL